jgi:signal transduction histidine kinase
MRRSVIRMNLADGVARSIRVATRLDPGTSTRSRAFGCGVDGGASASTRAGETGILWPALGVARVVLLGYAVVVNALHVQDYRHPLAAGAVLGILATWTLAAPRLYRVATRRPRLVMTELALALAALLLTPWVQGATAADPDAPTLASFWIAAPVLACAVQWAWRGGLASALVVGGVDLAVHAPPRGSGAGYVFLLVLTGLVAGYAAALVRTGTRERTQAAAVQATTLERERLARAVHDGVLQTLAYVQRRGTEIGGPAAELAEMARDQEEALRGLVQGHVDGCSARAAPEGPPAAGMCDVAVMLHRHAGRAVSVATPAHPVPLPGPDAAELVAAVAAALDNTARHAGGATAYVLLEDAGDAVVVSVGDDGPGIPAGRLDEAAAVGRMGVTTSIVGRLAALGGTAELTTSTSTGTEWELRVPRRRVTGRGSAP